MKWFRSIDLWVMGPARFHCATLLKDSFKQQYSLLLATVAVILQKKYEL